MELTPVTGETHLPIETVLHGVALPKLAVQVNREADKTEKRKHNS